MKTTYALNRTRSAIAPEIRAGVMIANFIWNSMNSAAGIVCVPYGVSIEMFLPRI